MYNVSTEVNLSKHVFFTCVLYDAVCAHEEGKNVSDKSDLLDTPCIGRRYDCSRATPKYRRHVYREVRQPLFPKAPAISRGGHQAGILVLSSMFKLGTYCKVKTLYLLKHCSTLISIKIFSQKRRYTLDRRPV